jgi:hypothetical protein
MIKRKPEITGIYNYDYAKDDVGRLVMTRGIYVRIALMGIKDSPSEVQELTEDDALRLIEQLTASVRSYRDYRRVQATRKQ